MIERLTALPCGTDEDLELGFDRRLPDVFLEPARTDRPLDGLLVGADRATCDSLRSHLSRTTPAPHPAARVGSAPRSCTRPAPRPSAAVSPRPGGSRAPPERRRPRLAGS